MLKKYLTIFYFFVFSTIVYADMGAIVPGSDVNLSEPGQKAIILYNGKEEVLILETDLAASKSVGALRFIPFPSEPKVEVAPTGCFDTLNNLIKKYDLKYVIQYRGLGELSQGNPVDLLSHKKLGAHDVTVIKVNDATHFRKWVNDYFKQKNLPQQDAYPEIEKIVSDYIGRNISYFVFDFVELNENIVSIEPLAYRFQNEKLFYPLETSNTFSGTGRIDLIVFAHYAQKHLYSSSFGKDYKYFEVSTSANVSMQELSNIYPNAQEFFNQHPIVLQAFKYEGELKFKDDILIDYTQGIKELKPTEKLQ